MTRRESMKVLASLGMAFCIPARNSEAAESVQEKRGSQRGIFITDKDFPYFTGKYPPRVIDFTNLPKQEGKAIYNAWGLCIDDSCAYVPLKQRYEGYKKYSASITAVTSAFGGDLRDWSAGKKQGAWDSAFEESAVKALRRAVLFGNTQLISENYGTSNEALVCRFYVNEAYYALTEIRKAVASNDSKAASDAWDLARDSWNSYLTVINRAVVPKVGEKFPLID